MVVIGKTGTGKSSLCNILAGKDHNDSLFPSNNSMDPGTNKTTGQEVLWRGRRGQPFYLIDTPGLKDPRPGADSTNITAMVEELKSRGKINIFLIAFNGSDPRFDDSLVEIIKIFIGMFGGREFLEHNTVFEITRWSHDRKSVNRRGEEDEAYWSSELNRKLEELFGITTNVPTVFIDSLYDNDDEDEVAKLREETEKLLEKLNNCKPFSCEDFEAVKSDKDKLQGSLGHWAILCKFFRHTLPYQTVCLAGLI